MTSGATQPAARTTTANPPGPPAIPVGNPADCCLRFFAAADRRHHRQRRRVRGAFAIGTRSNYLGHWPVHRRADVRLLRGLRVTEGWTPGKKMLGLSVRGPGGAPKPTSAGRDPQRVDAAPIVPFIGGLLAHRRHRDRGDDQQQPDQAGQARQTRGRHPGRQGLTPPRGRQITIPSSSTTTSPLTDSTVSMIDHDLIV